MTREKALHSPREDPSIQVVILDIILPDRVDLEVVGEITKAEPRSTTVVMMSAAAYSQVAYDARNLGTSDLILNPPALSVIEASVSVTVPDYQYRKG